MRNVIEVGLDEAGRGPCFGRLYTAAVIWPSDDTDPRTSELVRDSKTIKPAHMQRAYEYVISRATEWHVTFAEADEVDQYGPLEADMRSLHRCLDLFNVRPEHILMDGNYFKPDYLWQGQLIPCTTVVAGDSKYYSIAAASIIAKWTRDQYIFELCDKYPELDQKYGLRSHKGYVTAKHKLGMSLYGITQYHRKSYKCCQGATKVRPKIIDRYPPTATELH